MKERPIISVKEARKLLGIEARGLTDAQVMEIIIWLDDLAKEQLNKKHVIKSNNALEL